MLKHLFTLIRFKHWVKNLIIFAPLVFSNKFENLINLNIVFIVFINFCILSSIIYIFNDICDYKNDKKNKLKKKIKPIANGSVSLKQAYILIFILSLFGLYFSLLSLEVKFVYIGFLLLNIFYSLFLKYIPIIDIFSVATSYIFRIYSGALIIHVELSSLMFATVFTSALFIVSLKRKKEFDLNKDKSRSLLKYYSKNIHLFNIIISAALTLILYTLYVLTINQEVIFTLPVIFFIFFRLFFTYEQKTTTDSPVEIFFADKTLLISTLIFSLIIIFNFYY